MIMYPGSELSNDPTNWWGQNPACMVALLKECGFAKVDAAWSMEHRSVYHAWRTDALRRSRNLDERVIGTTETRRRKLRRGWRLIREGLGLRRDGDSSSSEAASFKWRCEAIGRVPVFEFACSRAKRLVDGRLYYLYLRINFEPCSTSVWGEERGCIVAPSPTLRSFV